MNRIALWLQTSLAAALFVVAMLGVTNSVHLIAKIIYALLIAASSAALTHAYHRRQT